MTPDQIADPVRKEPSELAYSWPAIPFALSIPMVFVNKPLAWVLLVGSFVPCCLIRDWWVRRA